MTHETPQPEELQAVREDLQRHRSALSRLQAEMIASRLEVAGARGETVQFKAFLHRSQAEVVALRTAEANLRAEIGALHASLSWRVSAPVRIVGRLLRRR